MGIEALDKTTIWILMILGGIFAIVGLYLIIRRSDDKDAARIELFGLKFQSSSAGTLVFLIGAGFLVTPLIVSEKPVDPPITDITLDTTSDTKTEAQSEPDTAIVKTDQETENLAVVLPDAAGSREIEPNNLLTEANQIARGNTVGGRVNARQKDYADWYVLPTDDVKSESLRIQVRTLSGECTVRAFNELEEEMISKICSTRSGSVNMMVLIETEDHIFIRIGAKISSSGEYELLVH